MRLTTSEPIFITIADGQTRVASPAASRDIAVAPEIVTLLALAEGGVEREHALATLELPESAFDDAVVALAKLGFLTVDASPDGAPAPAAMPPPWDGWGVRAWWFHQTTRNAPHLSDEAEVKAAVEAIAATERPLPWSPDRDEPVLLLPRVWSSLDGVPFKQVLEERRTQRAFVEGAGVDMDAFSTLLHYSFGPLRFAECGPMGVLELRGPASAGARHEIGACVVAFDVEGVRPGVYRYDGVRHGLVLLSPDVQRSVWNDLTFGQGFFDTCAFAVVLLSDARQVSWKYHHPRGYRLLFQNVGHTAQVFTMTASAVGLGCAITGAFHDDGVEAQLALADEGEFATFVMACGVPEVDDRGRPLDLALPHDPWDPAARYRR